MALSGLFESESNPDDDSMAEALTGNLCRCTGYLPILDAGRAAAEAGVARLAEIYPDGDPAGSLAALTLALSLGEDVITLVREMLLADRRLPELAHRMESL